MILRAEKPNDYNNIACLTYDAFIDWKPSKLHVHESEMIALARQRKSFDSELSIIAEIDGEIVGHILLIPSNFMVMGNNIKGVLLGPIGIKPKYKKTGIGSALIKYGHKIASKKGYELSLLCGHADYYPKFGYINNTFSFKGTKVYHNENSKYNLKNISHRPIRLDDISLIYEWQCRIQKYNNLAILFDNDLMDYHTNSVVIESFVITQGDKLIGFIKRHENNPSSIETMFFEQGSLEIIINYISSITNCEDGIGISLPIEIFSSIKNDSNYKLEDKRNTNKHFMICPLNTCSIINEYCNGVNEGTIDLGVISYPPYVDVDV